MSNGYREVASGLDLRRVALRGHVTEGSDTPPNVGTEKDGQWWLDTSVTDGHVMKYWDSAANGGSGSWVRVDGGGDIPNGMVRNRHVADDAAIALTKIAGDGSDANLQVTIDNLQQSVGDAVTNLTNEFDARLDTLEAGDAGMSVREIAEDAISDAGLDGAFVTVNTDQSVDGVKTFVKSPIVPVATTATQAVQLSQLTAEATARAAGDTTNANAISAETTRATGVEGGLNTRLTAAEAKNTEQDTRLGTAENDIDALESSASDLQAAIDAEEAAREAADTSETNARTAADTALGDRIDAEAASRASADTANANAISAETTRATAAENALGGRVTALEGVDNFTQAEFNTFNTSNTAALALKADLVGGKIPLSQIPNIALVDVRVIDWDSLDPTPADAAAALADLTGMDEGDVAVINGGPGGAFIYTGSGWIPLSAGADAATDAEVAAAVLALRTEVMAAIAAGDNALDARLDALEAVDYATQAELDAAVATLEDADQTNADAIAAETTRATAAESALGDRIDDEVADRGAADNQIRTDFAAADATIAASVTAETAARTSADTALGARIDTEHTHHTTAETALGGRIDGVVSDLAAEVTARTDADSDLQSQIDALSTSSSGDLAAEVARATAAEDALQAAIDAEAATRATADSTETTARTNADTALGTRIDTEVSDRTAAVSAEATTRASADTALGTRVDNEATARADADTALGLRIDAAESAANTAVTAEAAARSAADTAVRGEFAAADTAIRGEFAAADVTLQNDINTRALDSNTVHKTGNENVGGTKTFTSPVGVPTGVAGGDAVNVDQLHAYVASEAFDSSDLEAAISAVDGRVDDVEAAAAAETTRVNAALALKADLVGGKVPVAQLPALALTNVSVYADMAARDAATGMDRGDVAIVTDADGDGTRQSFIYDGTAWVPLSSPADVTEEELAAAVAAGLDALRTELTGLIDAETTAREALATRLDAEDNRLDGLISDEETRATGAETALDGRLDTLEATTAAYRIPTLRQYAVKLTGMVEGTEFVVTHNLGSRHVITTLYDDSDGGEVFADVRHIDNNTVGVTVDPTYTDGDDLNIVLIGGPVDGSGHGTMAAFS